MSEIAQVTITREQARDLTDRTRSAGETFHDLLLETHETGAWAALGYESWREYAIEEFNVSKSRAYRLLDQARVIREITEDRSQIWEKDQLPSETQAAELAKVPEGERAEVWQKVVDVTDGKPTAAAIRDVVSPPPPATNPFEPPPTTLPESPDSEEEHEVLSGAVLDRPVRPAPAPSPEQVEAAHLKRVSDDLRMIVTTCVEWLAQPQNQEKYARLYVPLASNMRERVPVTAENIEAAAEAMQAFARVWRDVHETTI
jgi:hypothetical protein